MLTTGNTVPDFKLPSSQGGEKSLTDFKGKWLILYFYPKDDTPGCTKEACSFRDHNEELKGMNAVVVGVSKDPLTAHAKFIEKYGLPFELLADTELKLCEAFGVWKAKSMYGKTFMGISRDTFLINPEGKIVKEWRGVKVDGHTEKVKEAIIEASR